MACGYSGKHYFQRGLPDTPDDPAERTDVVYMRKGKCAPVRRDSHVENSAANPGALIVRPPPRIMSLF